MAFALFGSLDGNRKQFNLMFLRPAEKDTNSSLNTMADRDQNIVIGNLYVQDFIWPGYTVLVNAVDDRTAPAPSSMPTASACVPKTPVCSSRTILTWFISAWDRTATSNAIT